MSSVEPQDPFIRFEQVSFDYTINQTETLPVLSDISFEVFPGEYLAIIGHNGSGKSTLAKHFNALHKPSKGDVWVDGMNTQELSMLRQIRQQVGIVFQHPDNQIIGTIVEDDIAFGLENIGIPHYEMDSRIDFALQAVGMTAFRNRPPHHLSGGQKQRIAVAGIIAMMPKCLVLDEATSMLDTYGRHDILRVLRQLHKNGMTIITVTHHMSEVTQADRVLVMEEGKIVMEGTPREIFSNEGALKKLQLDIPQAGRMARIIHQQDHEFNPSLIYKQEVVDEVTRIAVQRGVKLK